jgi:hypothetical protein
LDRLADIEKPLIFPVRQKLPSAVTMSSPSRTHKQLMGNGGLEKLKIKTDNMTKLQAIREISKLKHNAINSQTEG